MYNKIVECAVGHENVYVGVVVVAVVEDYA